MNPTQGEAIKILMFPWLAHGHISPFLNLGLKLAARNFVVHLCSTPVNLQHIKNNTKHHIQLVELHLPSTPELPSHHHTTNGLPPHLMDALKEALHAAGPSSFSSIVETLKPDLVIYDFIQSWAPVIAESHNIPAVQFFPTNASSTSYLISLGAGDSSFPFPEIWMSEFEKSRIPVGTSTNKHASEATRRSHKMLLIRTLVEIEGKYLDHLSSVLSGKKMVPVGPLVRDPEPVQGFDDLIMWLDDKDTAVRRDQGIEKEGKEDARRSTPTAMTVLVSFGSEYYPTKEEIHEIAIGLELTLVNFIWVVRLPKTGEKHSIKSLLPEGFVERIGKRGMVIEGWAPQARILAHPSIGGFVSHCGWSSVLESMRFGVPIVAMPMQTDQPLNARLVTAIGAGLEVERDGRGEYKRDEICRVIRRVVVEEDGVGIRRKARELSQVINEKGEEYVDVVAQELAQICKEYGKLA